MTESIIIERKYVTIQTAQQLKKNGFNVRVESYYLIGAISAGIQVDFVPNGNIQDINSTFPDYHPKWSRPEQWQVIEWFRIVHNIYIEVSIGKDDKNVWYDYYIYKAVPDSDYSNLESESGFNTPQEAYEAAIVSALNEIKR